MKKLISIIFIFIASSANGYQLYQAPNKYSDSVFLTDTKGNPSTSNYEYSIAQGLIAGAKPFSAYGERTSTVAETNFPIWPDGAFAIPAAAGVQMSVVSTSASDTNTTGTGLRSVQIDYLDHLLAEKTEVVNLNGITPVLTVATDIRFIQCMHVVSAGTSGSAGSAGTITASNGGVIYSQINTGAFRCSSAFRMVPANYQLRIVNASAGSISGTAAASSQIKIVANYIDGYTFTSPLMLVPFASIGEQDGAVSATIPPGKSFPPGTVVGAVHTTDKAATISITWFGYLEPYP